MALFDVNPQPEHLLLLLLLFAMDTKKILVYIRDSCIKRNNRGLLGLAAAFRKLDQDFSNGIQFEEFRKGFEELGINLPKGDLKRVFQVFDKDNSGTIDFKEFIDALKPPLPESRRRVVDLAFDKLDYNKDGVLQVEDLKGRLINSLKPSLYSKRNHSPGPRCIKI